MLGPKVAGADVADAVVKVYTVKNGYNYHSPWQMIGPVNSNGSGCIIGGQRILTNAHVVANQTFIQVRKAGEAKKYTARVIAVNHACDLALLTVDNKKFFKGVNPVPIGELPKVRSKVVVYGFPDGGEEMSITEGVVSRVEHINYTYSGAYLLACQIDAAINSGNSGGPVIVNGALGGVAFQGMFGENYENIGYLVPAPIVKHFLADIADGRTEGIPGFGVTMQKLENPDMRLSLGLAEAETGALVNRVNLDSPAYRILQEGDVLMAIDGNVIENDGTIAIASGVRSFFGYTLQQKQLGQSVKLLVLRKGRKLTLAVRLTKSAGVGQLAPQKYDVPPTYFIVGGLIFEPLTLNYLKEYAGPGDWYSNAPTHLLDLYLNEKVTEERRQVVVLVGVLADEVNIGFHSFKEAVIQTVNGRRISSMGDLVDAFDENLGQYHVVEDIQGFKIVLDRAKVNAVNDRILQKYKVDRDRSADLLSPRGGR